ncbi:MAG TPA: hypothetical protein VGQ71_06035, partial [Terriglobales bacterium]|nr:hypothetical protein [Terriglobales bacterium]
MRIIAFIIDGVEARIVPARGPPLWDGGYDAVVEAGTDANPPWDPSAQSAPEYPVVGETLKGL